MVMLPGELGNALDLNSGETPYDRLMRMGENIHEGRIDAIGPDGRATISFLDAVGVRDDVELPTPAGDSGGLYHMPSIGDVVRGYFLAEGEFCILAYRSRGWKILSDNGRLKDMEPGEEMWKTPFGTEVIQDSNGNIIIRDAGMGVLTFDSAKKTLNITAGNSLNIQAGDSSIKFGKKQIDLTSFGSDVTAILGAISSIAGQVFTNEELDIVTGNTEIKMGSSYSSGNVLPTVEITTKDPVLGTTMSKIAIKGDGTITLNENPILPTPGVARQGDSVMIDAPDFIRWLGVVSTYCKTVPPTSTGGHITGGSKRVKAG